MCLPMAAAIPLVLGIGQSVMQYVGASQQNSELNAYRSAQYKANLQDLFFKERQGAQQQYYTGVEAEQKLRQEQMQTEAGAARARTAAGEAGVTGLSVDDLQREYYLRQGEFAKDVKFNETARVDQIQTQLQGMTNQTQAEDNQLRQTPGPNPLGLLLGIGTAAGNAYSKLPSDNMAYPDAATNTEW